MNQKAFTESESTITRHGSSEYLPPSAKMQRLADKEKQSLKEGCTESRVCHELQSSQATTANMEKTAADKLTLIREQEGKIEKLMVLLESNVKRGQRYSTYNVIFISNATKPPLGLHVFPWFHEPADQLMIENVREGYFFGEGELPIIDYTGRL